MTACAQCGGPTPDGGTFAPDGTLRCSRCAAGRAVAVANATIVTAERDARERKRMLKVGAGVAAGVGAMTIVLSVIAALVVIFIFSKLIGCLRELPTTINVG